MRYLCIYWTNYALLTHDNWQFSYLICFYINIRKIDFQRGNFLVKERKLLWLIWLILQNMENALMKA